MRPNEFASNCIVYFVEFVVGENEEGKEREDANRQKKEEQDMGVKEEDEMDGVPMEEEEEPEVEDIDFDAEEDDDEESNTKVAGWSINSLVSLLRDKILDAHLAKIQGLMESTENELGAHEGVDRDLEYSTIVTSNELVIKLDTEVAILHNFVRELYKTKYQELEQIVQNPIEYAEVVKIIGNETHVSKCEAQLQEVVPNESVLTIMVTGTTTVGKPLPEDELHKVIVGCETIIKLYEAKNQIFNYVESRMNYIAPNLNALVGASLAARLIGAAGGLEELTLIPSCNVQVLGKQKKVLSGFSAASRDIHTGLLAHCDVVKRCPPSLKRRAVRGMAAKCALAARVDLANGDPSGATGRGYLEMMEAKVDKWQEPPPSKLKKALPAPLMETKKKRGGKRYRKQKEIFRVTELQKQKNRMSFLHEEKTDIMTGASWGMIGQQGSALTVKKDNKKSLSTMLSRKTQARLRRVKSSSGLVSGITSSIALTPVQGIELVDHSSVGKELDGAQSMYFDASSSFLRVINRKRKFMKQQQEKKKLEEKKRKLALEAANKKLLEDSKEAK